MKKYKGKSNRNARIKIDYRGIKPRVRFSYPDYPNQIVGSMWGTIQFSWYSISAVAFIYGLLLIESLQFFKEYQFLDTVWILCFTTVWFFLMPYLIYYPFRKKWDSLYPKFEAFRSVKYFKTFTEKDIIKKDNEIFCEIPLFGNVYFEYTPTHDFNKYLERVEVKEHNFKMKVLTLRKNKRKIRKNEFLWYIKFYFTKKPEHGKMIVIFA